MGHACMHAHSLHSCSTLCDPMDCSPPGSAVHGILQARILELVVISSFRGSSQPRDWTCVSCIGRQILYHWTTWEVPSQGHELSKDKLQLCLPTVKHMGHLIHQEGLLIEMKKNKIILIFSTLSPPPPRKTIEGISGSDWCCRIGYLIFNLLPNIYTHCLSPVDMTQLKE